MDDLDRKLNSGIVEFNNRLLEEKRRRDAELQEKIRQEKEEQQKKLDALNKKYDATKSEKKKDEIIQQIEEEQDNVPTLPAESEIEVSNQVETESAKVHFRDNWTIEIIDDQQAIKHLAEKGQTEYLKLNESALRQYAKIVKDKGNIPGVKFVNNRTAVQSEK